jgi:hypothetical protein
LLSTVVSFYLVPPLYTLLMHPRRHFFQHSQGQNNQLPQNKPALDTDNLSLETPL